MNKETLTASEGYIRLPHQHSSTVAHQIETSTKVEHGSGVSFRRGADSFRLSDSFYGGVVIRIRSDTPEMSLDTLEEAAITLTLDQTEKLIVQLKSHIDSIKATQHNL